MRRAFCFGVLLIASVAQAARRCSPEADYMIARAAECLQKDDVGCAKLKLDPLLEREPACAAALFIRGWITQYSDGNVKEGEAMQERAQKVDPSLTKFWEDRGHAIESQLTSQSFSHFDVQFYGAEDRDKAWQAVNYLNDMYDHLGSVFGRYPPKRIPVIIFTTEEFLEAWRAPFIGGFFDKRDGKIRIRVDEMPGGDDEFRHRARHELTHAFIYQLYPHELPSWMSEGIAEFYARSGGSDGFWKESRLDEIRALCKNKPWLTLPEIQGAISRKRVPAYVIQLAYFESEALVLWVAKQRGESWVPNVIGYLRDHGGTFEEAFQKVLGVSVADQLEALHHSWD